MQLGRRAMFFERLETWLDISKYILCCSTTNAQQKINNTVRFIRPPQQHEVVLAQNPMASISCNGKKLHYSRYIL